MLTSYSGGIDVFGPLNYNRFFNKVFLDPEIAQRFLSDFLAENRLIFAFQKNIVKNKKIEGYVRWFLFAERTKNKENSREDLLHCMP